VHCAPQTPRWIPDFAGITSGVWRFHSMGVSQGHYFTDLEMFCLAIFFTAGM
jgi:hypothetical protein